LLNFHTKYDKTIITEGKIIKKKIKLWTVDHILYSSMIIATKAISRPTPHDISIDLLPRPASSSGVEQSGQWQLLGLINFQLPKYVK